MTLLQPGRFAELTQLSAKALRVYAERGLLVPRRTDPATGYRWYAADQVRTGWLIGLLRTAGLSLDAIGEVLAAEADDALERLDREVGATERQHQAVLAVLARARLHLATARPEAPVTLDSTSTAATISTRVEPDRPVLSSLHRLGPDDLPRVVPAEVARLVDVAREAGLQVTGAPYGVFHAPVTEESDGPLEVVLPVDALAEDTEPAPGVRSHRVPGGLQAGREATGAETAYPALLAVYDEVRTWVLESGHVPVGPPHETWLSAPGDAEQRLGVWWPCAPDPLTRPGV